MFKSRAWSLCACAFLMACGEGVVESEGGDVTEESTSSLIGGTPTRERNEVGQVYYNGSPCTATLIHPRVVLTAKHCMGYTSCDKEGCEFTRMGVALRDDSRREHIYKATRFRSFSLIGPVPDGRYSRMIYMSEEQGYKLNDDVALVLLEEPVPESVAKPAKLASGKPEQGDLLTRYGFGCTDRETRSNAGIKRKYDFVQGDRINVGCAGDSGGPIAQRGEQGAIHFVTSGHIREEGPAQTDVFADVMTLRPHLDAQLESWGITLENSSPAPVEPDPVEPDPVEPDPVEPDPIEQPECRPLATEPPEQGMPMRVSLLWPEPTDLDLFVEDPAGQTIYYGNRSTPQGAQLKKADCLASSCPEREDGSDYSEWVEWSGTPLQGTYKVWAVNYSGRATANFTIQIESDRGNTSFEGVLAGARESSMIWSFDYKDEACP